MGSNVKVKFPLILKDFQGIFKGLNKEIIMASPVSANSPIPQDLTIKERFIGALPKIKEIAIEVFKAIAAAVLFVLNPTIFAVGVIIGVVWDQKSDETIDKIVNIVKKQPFPVVLALGIGSILCLQVTLGASSFLYGAYIGSKLAINSSNSK